MNRRIVIVGDDEFLSDEWDWTIQETLRAAGIKVDIVFSDESGMDAAINAALSPHN